MRIISGIARGRRLEAPEGTEIVRPTTDKVKEAIFSSIQFDIEGRRVLDLFAGSGQLGLEALSRGADSAVFIDKEYSSQELIKRNIKHCGFEEKSKVYKADFSAFLNGCSDSFDIAFLDPPYSAGLLDEALRLVSKFITEGGLIVCEYPLEGSAPKAPEGFSEKQKKYGKTLVSVFRKEGDI